MIHLNSINISFSGEPLLEEISFQLQKGERCGIIGRNGSGKSTLLKIIMGEQIPDAGSISIPKHYRIGYLQQHIHFTQPTLLQEAALGLPKQETDSLYLAETILFGLGFSETDLDKSPAHFSGGYHLRLHLAKVLIANPDCLLLDEPTNYLDILSIRWLTRFLKKWPGEFLLISHDREFMDAVSTHTLCIHRKQLRKMEGPSSKLFEQILAEEEIHEKTRIKQEKKHAHARHFVERFGAKASKAGQAQARLKTILKEPTLEKLNNLENLSFYFRESPFPGKIMLSAKHLNFSFTKDPLIENFSIEIEKNKRIGIIGKNGRGKSTILRLLIGELTATHGNIERSDNLQIGYFGQTHIGKLNPEHTIEEEIALANPLLNHTDIKSLAGAMLFSKTLSQKKIGILSGGEKSRVLLAKILAKPCNLLVLDEPTHHLDIESIEALMEALEGFQGTVLMVTHSELILKQLNLDQIVVCEKSSQKHFAGNYELFLEKLGWEEEEGLTPSSKKPGSTEQKWIEEKAKKAQLSQIKKEITSYEKKIEVLEVEQKTRQSSIEEGHLSPSLLKAMGEAQKQVEALYQVLEQLYEKYTNLSQ